MFGTAPQGGEGEAYGLSMPHFFFHIRQQDGVLSNERGSELPDLDAARREATISFRHLLAEGLRSSGTSSVEQIEVADSAGQTVAVVGLRDVLRDML